MSQIYGGQQIWDMSNEWKARQFVTNYAGYEAGDDISVVLALRKAKRGLADARSTIPTLDEAWQRKNVAMVIRHFVSYVQSLQQLVTRWPRERMQRAQEGTYRQFLHRGRRHPYRAV